MLAIPFDQSIISLKTNAVKNILFRLSTIVLQFAILKLCAYIAYVKNEYTSFLMFAEGTIQRSLFILSRAMRQRRSAIIVLTFTIAFTLASLYDTLLWALDSPGYVVRSQVANAAAFTRYLLPTPSYVSIISDPDPQQINIDETLASNLFVPGFNFSLTQSDYKPTPQAIIPPPKIITSTSTPRIYLDGDGFGVSLGSRFITDDTSCNLNVDKADSQYASWACELPGEKSTAFLNQPVGRPLIWWRDDWPTNVPPSGAENPWGSLSVADHGTASMKQVFTLTKGTKRHTFVQTTFIFSLFGAGEGIIPEGEITSLIQRSLTLFSNDPSLTSTFAKACIDAQTNGTNVITRGFMFQNATYPAIALTSVDFINIMGSIRAGGTLHVTHTSIELFRSEDISKPVQPAVPCDGAIYNIATGGRIESHPCFGVPQGAPTDDFGGQIDTSAVAIITSVLGDGSNDTSAAAFNHTGEQWYMANRHKIDQQLLSRAFLVGGNAGSVRIAVHHNESAISYLQLFLIILPFVMALFTSALMLRDKRGYYKKSLFASLAITCSTKAETHKSAGVITNPPTFVVLDSGIGTEDGPIVIDHEERMAFKGSC